MTTLKTQSGHAILITLTILLSLVVLGILGFLLWNNFLKPKDAPSEVVATIVKTCSDGENEAATNGTFCSDEMGVKFTVPTIFKGAIKTADIYEVFESLLDPETKTSIGNAEQVFSAKIADTDTFTLTIASEPLRSGYIELPHELQNTYFDKETGIRSAVITPIMHYDSATDTTTTTGTYALGEDVPSFMVESVRVFKGSNGDAGTVIINYLAVIHEKIFKVELNHQTEIGLLEEAPSAIDASAVYDELEAGIKGLLILTKD